MILSHNREMGGDLDLEIAPGEARRRRRARKKTLKFFIANIGRFWVRVGIGVRFYSLILILFRVENEGPRERQRERVKRVFRDQEQVFFLGQTLANITHCLFIDLHKQTRW